METGFRKSHQVTMPSDVHKPEIIVVAFCVFELTSVALRRQLVSVSKYQPAQWQRKFHEWEKLNSVREGNQTKTLRSGLIKFHGKRITVSVASRRGKSSFSLFGVWEFVPLTFVHHLWNSLRMSFQKQIQKIHENTLYLSAKSSCAHWFGVVNETICDSCDRLA